MITVQSVSRNFGGVLAVDNCSFEVPKGSITALIGPNGAGKTTLFNIIAGSLPPSGGQILLEQEDITGLPAHQLFHHGLVRTFQIPRMFEKMTVLENLMLVPGPQRGENLLSNWLGWSRVREEEQRIRERAEEVLEFLQITHVARQLAGELSGGQKKLVELGRTMMTNPRMVLLDEPGAGVNPTLLGKLCEDIRRLNQERGYTFCIIEHDMDLISQLCHPVVVMVEGSVLMTGTMEEVRANPQVQEAYLGGGLVEARP